MLGTESFYCFFELLGIVFGAEMVKFANTAQNMATGAALIQNMYVTAPSVEP